MCTIVSVLHCSLDSKLAGMERKFGISSRWKPHDKDYLAVQMGVLEERKNLTYLSLRSSVIKRHYLLQMKAKYAGSYLLCLLTMT